MKLLKWLFISLLIILLALGTAVYFLLTNYKSELGEMIVAELRNRYHLRLHMEQVKVSLFRNWPHASVELNQVKIESEFSPQHCEPLISAGSIAMSFNLSDLLQRRFTLQYVLLKDAEVTLVKNEDGLKNFTFQPLDAGQTTDGGVDADTVRPLDLRLNRITVRNTRFRYINRQRIQNVDMVIPSLSLRLENHPDGFSGKLDADLEIAELLFQEKKGAFLRDKHARLEAQVFYSTEDKSLCVAPGAKVKIEGELYDAACMLSIPEKKLSLVVGSPEVNYAKASSLLTPKMQAVLANFDVNEPFSARCILQLNIGQRQEPLLLADFKGHLKKLSIGNSRVPYSDIRFVGKVVSMDSTHTMGNAEEATVSFSPVSGKIYGHSFRSSIAVKNLTNPFINIDGRLNVKAQDIEFRLSRDFILLGSAEARVRYSGPAEKLNSREFLDKPMKLRADLRFRRLRYREINKTWIYEVNGDAMLNNRDLQFDSLRLITAVGQARLKGKAENFVNYVLGYSNGFTAHLAARADSVILDPLFESRSRNIESKVQNQKPTTAKQNPQKSKTGNSRFEFNVQLFAKTMVARQVSAGNVNADMNYKNDNLVLKSVNANLCDGKIAVKGVIQEYSRLKADVTVTEVNVNKLFRQFENFGQDAVTSENLKGRLSFDARFRSDLDNRMEVIPETMRGEVRLTLKEGHLLNYAPVQKLSNFLFRNRDFDNVSFSELNETFKINGVKMLIDELEIASNVLNLYVVDGIYDFKGNSNINLLLPWSNLKKRGKNYLPKNTGESASNTKGLKLNFQGPSKNMKLTLGHKEPLTG